MGSIEDVAAFRARARAWLEATVSPLTPAASRWGEGELDVEVFRDFGHEEEIAHLERYRAWHHAKLAAGFAAIDWAPEFGGQGLSKAHERAFAEEEAEFDVAPSHELFSVTTKLVAPTIAEFGNDEQKATFVSKFMRAEEFCCQLFSEPEAGSDLAGLTCKGVQDGEEWVLDGQKVWSSGAHVSTWGLAIVRTDPDVVKHAGLTAFLIPIPHPGVEVRLIKQMNGGAGFNEVFLSGCRIPDSLRIGKVGEGWKVALTVLGHERNTSGSSGKRGGSFEDLLGLARAMGRDQDPIVRQKLAKVYTQHRARSWAKARAAAAVRLGGKAGPEGSIGKLLWTEAMREISDTASLILGAKLTADNGEWGTYDWNDHVLGAPGYRIAGGSDEIQRNIIGERVLGLPGEPRVDRDASFSELRKRKP